MTILSVFDIPRFGSRRKLTEAELAIAKAAHWPTPVDDYGQPWYIGALTERDEKIVKLEAELAAANILADEVRSLSPGHPGYVDYAARVAQDRAENPHLYKYAGSDPNILRREAERAAKEGA